MKIQPHITQNIMLGAKTKGVCANEELFEKDVFFRPVPLHPLQRLGNSSPCRPIISRQKNSEGQRLVFKGLFSVSNPRSSLPLTHQ